MARAIHIIADDTPADMLAQAVALAHRREAIVSIGPAPRRRRCGRPIVSLHAPLGSAALAGMRLGKLTGDAELLHAWSPAAAQTARWGAGGSKILLSLSHLRGIHQVDVAISGVFDGLWALTVPTNAQRRELFTLGLSPERVFVLPPAAETSGDAPRRRNSTREKLGLDNGQFLLAAGGEMVHANGHKPACWAHAMARILTDNTRLIFPQSGPARRNIETFARSTGYDREIFFTAESLSPPDVLTASDAAIFLQRHDCGVGALAGAMACGLPILASNRPEIAECSPNGRAAMLSPAGDMRQAANNLLILIRNPKLRKKLGREASILAAKQFAPDIATTALRAIYSRVVSQRS